MRDRLKIMDQRYEEINRLLSDPQIVSDIKQLTALSKEQRSLEKTVLLFREQEKLEASIPDLKEMKASEDEEMAQMAALELEQAQPRIEQINEGQYFCRGFVPDVQPVCRIERLESRSIGCDAFGNGRILADPI